VLLCHAENAVGVAPVAGLAAGVRAVAHNMHAFQKVERKWSFVEDSLRVKAKEIGSNGHCIHGFNDGESASARTWVDAEKRGQGIGRNVAGTGTKIHVIMGEKHPLRVHVSGANVHDSRMAYRMMDGLNLKAASDLLRIKATTMTS
jgi:hypothetical protein